MSSYEQKQATVPGDTETNGALLEPTMEILAPHLG